MKKSIKKQIITRILNEPIKASNLLDHLSSVLYADREFYESLSNTQLKKEFETTLSYFMGKNFEFVNIDSITKIAKDIKKVLIKRINVISHQKNKKKFYELTVLLFALDYACHCNALEKEKSTLINNDKVQLCYDLAMLIDHCRRENEEEEIEEKEKWFNERLKKIKFN